jgi:hypothetical protein
MKKEGNFYFSLFAMTEKTTTCPQCKEEIIK